jgi:UDP-N-acetylglucosamine 2-epimerase (non-hydrolysing)
LIVFTAHRREHLGAPVEGMFRALRRLVDAYPNAKAFCPLHSNPAIRQLAQKHFEGCSRIKLLPPLDVRRFHRLLSVADLVMTDSGGIQEEATALGVPTVVMRHSSERTEGFRAGVLRLAGCHEDGIFSVASRLLEPNSPEYDAMRKPSAVYGDGSACRRIVSFLEKIS